ncbi:restriction endonuclease subunit S [uncultured Amnibacterium sp.]|uniref:restriction endonuclease subunit S n=1 Tax=uncultured Amnibacterium sp. TaxID=1631851 RepID=UPI0035CA5326
MARGRYITGGFTFVSEDKLQRDLGRNTARPGDIIFTQRGTLGQVALVPKGEYETFVVSQSQMRLRVDPVVADARYIYYASTTDDFLRQITERAISTGVPHINLGILAELEVPLPSIAEQQAIVEVLGVLDDKIAANIAIAATADRYLATLLEDLLDEASGTVSLGSIAAVNELAVKPNPGGQLRYVDIASVGVGTFEYPDVSDWDQAPGRARRALRRGDTIWSTVRPNRRSHALNLADDPLLVASTGLAVLTPTRAGFAYLYEVTKRPGFTAYLETVAEGSAYPAVRAERFLSAPVPAISSARAETFEAIAAPLREAVFAAFEENRTLTVTRDTLLPQLMSGDFRVRDAEKVATDAGA